MMLRVVYTPYFLRRYNKLPRLLQAEVQEKIGLFKQDPRHPFLKTHKLKGDLRNYYSFSVNYACRIIFEYDSRNTVALLSVGGHDIY